MKIRGFVKFSLVDYPGKMSCVLFVGRCNFRCPYCHNPHLVLAPESQPEIRQGEIIAFLEKRRRRLDGLVLTGGEPILHKGVEEFLAKVKSMGFLVKLDTNGSLPERAMEMVDSGLVDMLGLDYKAPAAAYANVVSTSVPDIAEKVGTLIKFAVDRGLPMDVRTTVHKSILSFDDLATMRRELDGFGVGEWQLQQFHNADVLDPDLLEKETYSDSELLEIAARIGGGTKVRGAGVPERGQSERLAAAPPAVAMA